MTPVVFEPEPVIEPPPDKKLFRTAKTADRAPRQRKKLVIKLRKPF
jgi:hypothetical protein